MTQKVFANDLNTKLEYSESNFNTQRKAAIRYAIESNLSTAIANFNFYSESTNEFQMPKLKETEWDLVENQVSIISFLQGISIGGKIYNGHTVVTNDKTEEVIKEEDICIVKAGDEYYHKINDKELKNSYVTGSKIMGVWNIDFEIRRNQHTGKYYVPRTEIGCYSSVVSQNNINNSYDTIYEYLNDSKNIIPDDDETASTIKQAYYTALGRERWATYKVENLSSIPAIVADMKANL